ncbi:MAG: response regulator transcription factor [Pseudomonadota bacterium]
MRILVVEDDAEVNHYITKSLREQGHTVDAAVDGRTGLTLATDNSYDVLLLDRMLPALDGLTLLKTLRAAGNATPALILSALGDVDDRVEGLKSGGDDYLVKPFAFIELMARLEVIARRGQPTNHSEIVLQSNGITVDLLSRKVTRDGETILLQAREFRLLEFLLRHKNKVVTRAMLLEHVWEYHFDPQTNVIDVHISRLRQKIDRDPAHSLITTIRGEGYTIADDKPAAA